MLVHFVFIFLHPGLHNAIYSKIRIATVQTIWFYWITFCWACLRFLILAKLLSDQKSWLQYVLVVQLLWLRAQFTVELLKQAINRFVTFLMTCSECRSKKEMPSLYPHVKGILYALKDKGIDVAIASRSPTPDIANAFLDKLGLRSMFVAQVSDQTCIFPFIFNFLFIVVGSLNFEPNYLDFYALIYS